MDINKLTSELGNVKLKHNDNQSKDRSAPKLTGFIDEKDIQKYQSTVSLANVEEWIELIKDITFETLFHPITKEDANTFIEAFEFWEKSKAKEFPESIKSKLEKITKGLDEIMNCVRGKDECVFVKTSSRSAKDTGIYREGFLTNYKGYLKKTPKTQNDRMICLLLAATEMLKMKNSNDVIMNFAISERIMQDMKLALSVSEVQHTWRE